MEEERTARVMQSDCDRAEQWLQRARESAEHAGAARRRHAAGLQTESQLRRMGERALMHRASWNISPHTGTGPNAPQRRNELSRQIKAAAVVWADTELALEEAWHERARAEAEGGRPGDSKGSKGPEGPEGSEGPSRGSHTAAARMTGEQWQWEQEAHARTIARIADVRARVTDHESAVQQQDAVDRAGWMRSMSRQWEKQPAGVTAAEWERAGQRDVLLRQDWNDNGALSGEGTQRPLPAQLHWLSWQKEQEWHLRARHVFIDGGWTPEQWRLEEAGHSLLKTKWEECGGGHFQNGWVHAL
jgi:hypothetical protein